MRQLGFSKAMLAISHPDYAIIKARERARAFVARAIEMPFLNGFAFPPQIVDLNLSFKCNLKCKMCGQAKNYADANNNFLGQELSLEKLKAIVDDVASFKPKIYLWGGEPLLYPKLVELIKYVKQKGLFCVVNTNATLLENFAADFVDSKLDAINVSIDGTKELHDKIRGIAGAFEKAEIGMRKIVELKKQKMAKKPLVKIYSTIMKENQGSLSEIVALAESWQADSLVFIHPQFVDNAVGKQHEAVCKKEFGICAKSWRGFSASTTLDAETLAKEIKKIRQSKASLPVFFAPEFKEDKIKAYYNNTGTPLRNRCLEPYLKADIFPNGNMVACGDFPDFVLGNIKEKSFSEIWNNERARAFRRRISRKLLPVCARCCGLYHF